MIAIDKGIPVPASAAWCRNGTRKTTPKYPWDQMNVGDSFFVPGIYPDKISPTIAVRSLRTGCKYATKVASKNGVKGVRVWRVA